MAAPVTAAAVDERRRLVNRLRRLAGQIRGLRAMVADEKECEDVLTQLRAAKSALNQVGLHVIAYTIKSCAPVDGETSDVVVTDALGRFLAYARPSSDAAASGGALGDGLLADASAERDLAARLLSELESTIAHLEHLVTEDLVCDDVLPVVIQAKNLLDRVGLQVIAHAMRTCLAPRPGATRDEVVDDAMAVFLRNVDCVR
jgi:DNA-binding FrmR family transcriptional regulator